MFAAKHEDLNGSPGWVPAIMAGAMFVIMLLSYHCERDIRKLEQKAA